MNAYCGTSEAAPLAADDDDAAADGALPVAAALSPVVPAPSSSSVWIASPRASNCARSAGDSSSSRCRYSQSQLKDSSAALAPAADADRREAEEEAAEVAAATAELASPPAAAIESAAVASAKPSFTADASAFTALVAGQKKWTAPIVVVWPVVK